MELGELSLSKALLFVFSSVGVLNTFLLSIYFLFFAKKQRLHNLYLAALLIVIGLREMKSVLSLFIENSVETLGFLGQSFDILIGPFLYLYVSAYASSTRLKRYEWLGHTLPYLIAMSTTYLVVNNNSLPFYYSNLIAGTIYFQWITYIVLAIRSIPQITKKLFNGQKLEKEQFWIITLIGSVFIIWLAYLLTHFGNYVLGGVSISIVIYLSVAVWFYKRKSAFYEAQPKYGSKKIAEDEAKRILSELNTLMVNEELYLSSDIKLADVSKKLNISTHLLSQLLNDNLQSSFNLYINQFRIQTAGKMIKKNHHLTLEAIGVDCGFKSKSAFYAAFKSVHRQTPAQFRKAHALN